VSTSAKKVLWKIVSLFLLLLLIADADD